MLIPCETLNLPHSPLERLQWLSHLGSGLGCVLYAWALRRWPDRTRLHKALGTMLLSLGFGMVGRSMSWVSAAPLWPVLASICFVAFPVTIGRLFEHLWRRGLPLVVKVFIVLGVVAGVTLTIAAPTDLTGPKGVLFACTHISFVFYLGVQTLVRRRAVPAGPRRSLLGAASLVAWSALPFMATDWADAFGLATWEVPRLGAVPTFLMLYFAGVTVHVQGAWGIRRALGNLGWMLVLAGVLSLVLEVIGGPVSFRHTLASALTLLAAAMLLVPLSRLMAVFRSRRTDVLLARLSELKANDHQQLIAALTQWPEVRVVSVIAIGDLQFPHESLLRSLLNGHGGALSRGQLERLLPFAGDDEQQKAIEGTLILFQSHAADYFALIDDASVVAVGFDESVDVQAYTPVMQAVAHSLRVLPLASQVGSGSPC